MVLCRFRQGVFECATNMVLCRCRQGVFECAANMVLCRCRQGVFKCARQTWFYVDAGRAYLSVRDKHGIM